VEYLHTDHISDFWGQRTDDGGVRRDRIPSQSSTEAIKAIEEWEDERLIYMLSEHVEDDAEPEGVPNQSIIF
jgi:hypothetical protein